MLFIAGYHASGKSYVSSMLASRFNVIHIETSSLVRAAHSQDRPDLPLGVWAKYMEGTYGETVFDDLISDATIAFAREETAQGRFYDEIIISGNRSFRGIEHITNRLTESDLSIPKERTIISVASPLEILYERFRERNREKGDAQISLEEFSLITENERDTGIEEIFRNANFHIDNGRDTGYLYDQMHEIATELNISVRIREGEKFIKV